MTDLSQAQRAPASVALPPMTLWRPSLNTWLLFGIAFLLALWPFSASIAWLWYWWTESPEYSHGMLLPPLCAFLLWTKRDALAETPFTGSWYGVALVAAAAPVYLLGRLATLHSFEAVAFWIALFGLVLALVGTRAFRIVWLPLVLLFAAIPLPPFFLQNLSAVLQHWSAELGVAVIRAFGIGVNLQGNVVDLGRYKLEVAEACSGVRYLFPLLTLGLLLAYLYRGRLWKRVVIALATLPLTVLMNGLRIGSIGIMVDRFGPQWAEGFVHDFQGWAMFMLTGLVLLGLLMLMHRLEPDASSWREAFGIPVPSVRPAGTVTKTTGVPRAFLAAAGVVLATAVFLDLMPTRTNWVPPRSEFVLFPDHIGEWSGHRTAIAHEFLEQLKLDDYLLSDYVRAGAPAVNVYLAYYKAQQSGQAIHSPRSCLPGGGWQITEFGQRELPGVTFAGKPVRVNRAIIELGNQRQLVYYWFQQRGRTSTNELLMKWELVSDALTMHRTDGALVRLTTSLPLGTDVAAAERRVQELAAKLEPLLPAYIPN